MRTTQYYGLVSVPKEEKEIITNINTYLATLNRTTSKAKTKSMLDARLPFKYKHFYWNLNKETGTWFELFPNADLENNLLYSDKPELGWIIKVIYFDDEVNFDRENASRFISNVINAAGKAYLLLTELKE